jgi:hypothetical protein
MAHRRSLGFARDDKKERVVVEIYGDMIPIASIYS